MPAAAPVESILSFERSFAASLEELSPTFRDELARRVATIERLQGAGREALVVCLLGASGIGKSTLVNALLGGGSTVLPAGGVGPMTALATQVRWAEEPYFEVEYHPRKNLNQLRFALTAELRRLGTSTPANDDGDEAELAEAVELAKVASNADALRSQAAQLVTGNQSAQLELPFLLDALRAALGQKLLFGTTFDAPTQARLDRIGAALKAGKLRHSLTASGGRALLREHAAGFLAPLIRTIEVGWRHELLRDGLVLVDLPGVGVANDLYQDVTKAWMAKAAAVLVVTDRAGFTEATVELLSSSRFLQNLLYHDPAGTTPAPVMLVVGTKLDASAEDARRDFKEQHPDEKPAPFEQFLVQVRAQMAAKLTEQVRAFLPQHAAAKGGGEETNEGRRAAVERVLEGFQPLAISAREAILLEAQAAGDDEARPTVRSLESTGVPTLVAALRTLSDQRAERANARVLETVDDARRLVVRTLARIEREWTGSEREEAAAARLLEALTERFQPLELQHAKRWGGFHEAILKTIPAAIDEMLSNASREARVQLDKFVDSLADYRWNTLRATVQYGGSFSGTYRVDVPRGFSDRVEDPIAVLWTNKILPRIRHELTAYGKDRGRFVEAAIQAAREIAEPPTPATLAAAEEAARDALAELDGELGKDALAALQKEVRATLYACISQSVRASCEAFVKRGSNDGSGVKQRITILLTRLASEVLEEARDEARKLLLSRYGTLATTALDHLQRPPGPVAAVREALTDGERNRQRRRDASRRAAVLVKLEQARQALEAPVTGEVAA